MLQRGKKKLKYNTYVFMLYKQQWFYTVNKVYVRDIVMEQKKNVKIILERHTRMTQYDILYPV